MTTAINTEARAEIQYGSTAYHVSIASVNRWEKPGIVRDYITLNGAPTDIIKIYVAIDGRYDTNGIVVEDTEVGTIVITTAAGYAESHKKQEALRDMAHQLFGRVWE